tara:strand:- start:1514 stop:1930 length:417 start_codon:yes stop_codon:yes gene_type:complete
MASRNVVVTTNKKLQNTLRDTMRNTMLNTNITYTFSEDCPITESECNDLDMAFDETNLNILIKDGNKVVSCLGCFVDKDENRIHISASCTASTSRKQGFNGLINIILFYYAMGNKIRYITADTNSKSRPLMEKYLNAS